MSDAAIRLIVGLGNPGTEYAHTRHNIGFDFVDLIAGKANLSWRDETKFFGQVCRLGDLWLLKPTTFMNRSGSSVQALTSYYKIEPEEILVVHDELDLVPGTLKLKLGGGNAGHNGLKDIQAKLSSPQFWRLRVGIGHPRQFCPQQPVFDWVLGRASTEHQAEIDRCLAKALTCVDFWAEGNWQRAQRTLAPLGSIKPAKPKTSENQPPKETILQGSVQ